MPEAMARQLERGVAVEAAAGWQRLAVVGRGVNYGTAFEAALKFAELTGVIAAPWSWADFLHGPIAIVDPGFPILAIAPPGPTLPGMRDLLAAAAERGAELTVIGEGGIPLEPVEEWLTPLVAVIPAQQLAVGAAERLGRDVDHPSGLRKVTLTS
jgi:glucosamine--fructose-6-phosphate aminotransferase (isomerizing)